MEKKDVVKFLRRIGYERDEASAQVYFEATRATENMNDEEIAKYIKDKWNLSKDYVKAFK